jgi:hydroxymethylglutaryl-CoA lyase
LIDFGSLSPKAIPQMQDTAAITIDLSQTKVTTGHYCHQRCPYMLQRFQMRNTHKTIAESLVTLDEILEIADKTNKKVVAYLSMGFGNPYGDPWDVEIVGDWTEKLSKMGVKFCLFPILIRLLT